MAIYHDVYQFRYADFVAKFREELEAFTLGRGDIASFVDSLWEANTMVSRLAADYGGWDKAELIAELIQLESKDMDQLGTVLPFILYKYASLLRDSDKGFGEEYSAFYRHLEAKKGIELARLLVYGHPINELIKISVSNDPNFGWSSVRESSSVITSAYWIGWLNYQNKPQLRNLVNEELVNISSSVNDRKIINQIKNQLVKSNKMLDQITETVGLFIVISG